MTLRVSLHAQIGTLNSVGEALIRMLSWLTPLHEGVSHSKGKVDPKFEHPGPLMTSGLGVFLAL